ncbi:MAG: tripartite tricarboxylate transporter substrate binding protein [Polaromonas sp.]|uniref:Bug family tripartite tricarboxylate transporter substrate binding protein n=1 Tax=Polaromonas sp. TaxID=1869339 RepID=UPI0025E08AE0|nr:tripartite tricarboxylate transporter substrate binding protein [Polaromonas sp.]MBI2726894.1 tripartite tricarboxylate transporter substrate binding protein [Polaromonas sp.]
MNFRPSSRRSLVLAAVCALPLGMMQTAVAQTFPDKVIRIINPYAAGGPSDTIVRMLAAGMSTELGQRVIVENKPGAGTVIGANLVAKAAPDGYTLLLATVAPLVVQPAIGAALPYDAHKDFAMVGMFATVPNLISVHPSVPVNSIAELIAYAKKTPGKLNYASAGSGTGPHLGGELFNRMAGVKLTHVPYAGAAPAVLAVLSGQVEVSFVNITPQIQHVKAGKLRALAIGSSGRSKLFPEVPTMSEAGLKGYLSESWNGLAAPAGTPPAVIDRLYRAMAKVMASPAVQEGLLPLGADATVLGPAEFDAYVKADEKQLVPVIKTLGLTNN